MRLKKVFNVPGEYKRSLTTRAPFYSLVFCFGYRDFFFNWVWMLVLMADFCVSTILKNYGILVYIYFIYWDMYLQIKKMCRYLNFSMGLNLLTRRRYHPMKTKILKFRTIF